MFIVESTKHWSILWQQNAFWWKSESQSVINYVQIGNTQQVQFEYLGLIQRRVIKARRQGLVNKAHPSDRDMATLKKNIIWTIAQQNQQHAVRPAKTQISLHIRSLIRDFAVCSIGS